jgi:hypothetical protein
MISYEDIAVTATAALWKQWAGNGPIDGKYHLICGSLGATVKLQYSMLCVTAALLG